MNFFDDSGKCRVNLDPACVKSPHSVYTPGLARRADMHCLVTLLLFDTALALAQVQSPPQPADTIGPPSTDATAQTIAVVASVTPAGSYSSLNVYVITGNNPPKVLALPAGVTIGPDVSISPSGDTLAFVAYSGGKPQIAVAGQATGFLTLFPADVEGCVLPAIESPLFQFFVCQQSAPDAGRFCCPVQRRARSVAGSTQHCNRDFLAPTCVLVISDGVAPAIRYALGRRGVCLYHAA